MASSSHVFDGVQRHVMNLQELLLPGLWPVQGNMSSLWAVLLLSSFLWIIYRLVSVFCKPASEIEELLGQDIPPVPEIALSSVGSTSIVLYWKLPENYHTPVKNHINVNGVSVADNDGSSTAITVAGLLPGNHYIIRAFSSNAAGYSSFSQPLHVQTVPEDGHRAARLLSITEPNPAKRPSTGGGRRISSAPSETDRDNSAGVANAKSVEDGTGDEPDTEDVVARLTKRLDLLRSENEDLQGQLDEELSDGERARAVLAEERDKLKKQHDDKEKSWQESRKHLLDLEKASKQWQRKKSKKESEVQQKKKKRQQMKEEMGEWSEKQVEMREDTEKLHKDRLSVEEKQAVRLAEARKAIEDAQAHGKSLEEDIRDWGVKVKALEDQKREADEKQEEEEQEADRLEKEMEIKYQARLQDLEVRYQEVYGANVHVQNRVQQLLQLQVREPHRFAPAMPSHIGDYGYAGYGQPRSTRGSISRASTLPYAPQQSVQPSAALQQQQHQLQNTTYASAPNAFAPMQTISPVQSQAFPALSSIDTLTMHSDRDRLSLTQPDFNDLTGGAQMSPSADGLLPSNLLSDDPNGTMRPRARPSIFDAQFRQDQRSQDPSSPASQHSGARSFFPSPPEAAASLANGGGLPNPDIDRALNNLNDAAPRRPSGFLFSFNSRRTAKPSLRDPPALGTLRQGESQSFPRDLGDEDDDDDVVARAPGHQKQISNPWMNMSGLLSRNAGTMDDVTLGSTKSPAPAAAAPRRSRRLFSSSKMDSNDPFYGLDRTSSPRPASTYSYDQSLLRPSSESHPLSFNAAEHLRLRNSPIGTDWSSLGGGGGGGSTSGGGPVGSNGGPGGAYSNNHSRRQSIQHGSTSNLSLGSTPLDFDDIVPKTKSAAPVAPIGAGRPGKSRKQKLNPGAPSFISNVFSRAEKQRTPKSDKGAFDSLFDGPGRSGGGSARKGSLDLDPMTPSAGGGAGGMVDDSSPPVSRMSRDGHSVMTSTTDSHDSIGGESDMTSGTGGTGTSTSTSTPREGFMSRLTRKSSSTKFWGGGEKKGHGHSGSIGGGSIVLGGGSSSGRRRSSEMPLPVSTPSEADEDAATSSTGGDYLGVLGRTPTSGADSTASTPIEGKSATSRTGLSWGKMMGKKSKKADSSAVSETSESREDDE